MWKCLQGWPTRPSILNAELVFVPFITTHCLLKVWPDVPWLSGDLWNPFSADYQLPKAVAFSLLCRNPPAWCPCHFIWLSAWIYNSFALWKTHEITSTWEHIIQDTLDPCSQAMVTHLWLSLPLEKRSEFLCWHVSTYKNREKRSN